MRVIEGRAFVRGEVGEWCIGIEGGKIVKLKKSLKSEDSYDFDGNLILPAGIDVHVHFRDPGSTYKEDFWTGTLSAACGGISCVMDMPNTLPPVTTVERVQEKLEQIQGRANVDFGLYAALTEESDFLSLRKVCDGFKCYLAPTTNVPKVSDLESLPKGLGRGRGFFVFHCEDPSLFIDLPERRLEDHAAARPSACEASSITKLRRVFGGRRIHIAHISSIEGLRSLEGSGFSSEVTPHHLFLNASCKLGPLGKVNPPLRRKSDQNGLWRGLLSGMIDIVASDHAPHTIEEKEEAFQTAPSGVPGVETMLPLLLYRVRMKQLSLERFVEITSTRPAELLSLNKGKIEIGYEADLIAVDIRKVEKIRADNLHSKCDWTPFEGWKGIFPLANFVRGMLVMMDGEIEEAGKGRHLVQKASEPRKQSITPG